MTQARAPLERYRAKRDFSRTAEPAGAAAPRARIDSLAFVVQRHDARRLHYDFRLEWDGVLKSWAVPKGPSLDPRERRLAVRTEDHPMEYAAFEGTIPPRQYGAGEVAIWDRGTWSPEGDFRRGLAQGHVKFSLDGERLRGRWALIRLRGRGGDEEGTGKENWLLVKESDDEARSGPAAEVTQVRPSRARAGEATRVAPVPAWIGPQLATNATDVPRERGWAFEVKYDGYRLGARLEGGKVRLYTRNRHNWTERFRDIAAGIATLEANNAWIDGEVVAFRADGRSSFGELQRALDANGARDLVFVAFDLPFLDGADWRDRPLAERRERLRKLLADSGHPRLRFSESIAADAGDIMQLACRWGLEGLIAKRVAAPYRSARTRDWLKLKCRPRDELVIAGYTDPEGGRVGFGALLLGAHEGGRLVYRGRVGTGFDDNALRAVHARLRRLARRDSPFAGPLPAHPRKSAVHWVEPRLVAEIEYTELTDQGVVRQASFVGLREDKPARAIRTPRPAAPPPATDRAVVAGVRITHPERAYADSQGLTKLDLAAYYGALGERFMAQARGRPLSLVRCPSGDFDACFYQRHPPRGGGVESVRSRSRRTGEDKDYVLASTLERVVSLVQWGVVEFHTWGCTAPRIDRPDRITLDLDPDPKLAWPAFREACELVRALLDELGLRWFVKTTGGKGIHFVMPLERRHGWEEVKSFSQAMAVHLATALPSLFTARMTKARRPGKVFVDYLRNADRATAIAAYAARARAGLPVSMPIAWEALVKDVRGAHFNVRNALDHVATRPADPWADYTASAQRITAGMRRALKA
jgi:bifunctional non-homologous end joining protein LigD